MGIKKDKRDEFNQWLADMQSKEEIDVISFFNLLCFESEKGYDSLDFILNAFKLKEKDRHYCVGNDEIYKAMCAFSDFHESGDDFRFRWNSEMIGIGYATYIERGSKKYVVHPLPGRAF